MIEDARGNLLEADADALVNTVNCVGHMGKGIALQFKLAFPENFEAYEAACKRSEVRPGRPFVFATGLMHPPRYIINFPTKRHWRGDSRYEDIEAGLVALVAEVRSKKIQSIAIPPLGCGNGGLDWSIVRPMIVQAFSELSEVRILLFAPMGAPAATAMPVRTKRPGMTRAKALFIKSMEGYLVAAYRLTLLEIQKLAYFLQEGGEPLQLRYEGGHYGPYAPNLNKVLEAIEGHFIRGYGDSPKPDVEIELLPGAASEAGAYLATAQAQLERLERVKDLIAGFETPYGMELLSSVHWVSVHGDSPARHADDALNQVHAWSDRKRRLFKPAHIRIAWQHLRDRGWLS